jgi:prepilin-type N-terminal cleavage/methylation domain-containing protein
MKKMKNGFTLVELLIVIALIAILSVAVLATINPIEQSNKAKDASIQNDAAEVMNAYERYYTVKATYPWMDADSSAIVSSANVAWIGRSDMVGAGLCQTAAGLAGAAVAPATRCDASTTRGLLISTDELKDSFLTKGYSSLFVGDPGYSAASLNYLWIDKKGVALGNSVYVCYIPKAKSNRTVTTVLYKPTLDGSGNVTVFAKATPAEIAAADYATVATSLMKCVP